MAERAKIREALSNTFMQCTLWTDLDEETQNTIIRRVERGCLNKCIAECSQRGIDRVFTEKKFVDRYSAICSKIMVGLDPGINTASTVLTAVINGDIDPHSLAEMSSNVLHPEANIELYEEIELRKQQKVTLKVSHAYTCKKCQGNSTIPLPFQGRAADECESRSIKCIGCGHTWMT